MATPVYDMLAADFSDPGFNLPSPLSASPSTHSQSQLGWGMDDRTILSPNAQAPKSGRKKRAASETEKLLACKGCRQKKIKCQREEDSCRRCRRLKLQCVTPEGDGRKIPSSKSHVWMLQQRIQLLERELEKHGLHVPSVETMTETPSRRLSEIEQSNPVPQDEADEISPSLISRICARKSQLNADEVGRLHFFGPTSSLHTAESTSSWFVRWGELTTGHDNQIVEEIPLRLQEYLLERYWKYQHAVIPVIHKEAFLHDMRCRRGRYYSKALLYAIFACGARISEFPELRSLVLSRQEDGVREEPYLLKKATTLVEEELRNSAGITTVQSLQLLSVIYCCTHASDNKGWMDSGRAIRLAYELGLHQDVSELQSMYLTQIDLDVRKTVFWGCFVLDRMWALYLGRPYSIKMEDVTVARPSSQNDAPTYDTFMLEAWTGLLEIVGRICDVLNQKHRIPNYSLNEELNSWGDNLGPEMQRTGESPPSTYILHMQYCSAVILTQRPAACFGTSITDASHASLESRSICVENALRLAEILQSYRNHHGSACTLLGTSLYNITIAVIVLIANWADGGSVSDESQYLSSIDSCIQRIREMEVSYIVARTVLKQLTYLMRRCHFPALPSETTSTGLNSNCATLTNDDHVLFQLGQELPLSPDSGSGIDPAGGSEGVFGQDLFLMMDECDALRSVGPWTYPMDHPIL